MQIEEHDKLVKLFDVYGGLLSKKQNSVLEKHLNFDLGESELAAEFGESRQAIHDAIFKAKKQLFAFEEKCKICENLLKIKSKLVKIEKNLPKEASTIGLEIQKIIEEI